MDRTLYGREEALGLLRDALAQAAAGRGRLALVSGEPGIGKSALASVIARDAEAVGAVVTWGRAWEFAEAPPYFPVMPCLRALELSPRQDAFQLWESVASALAACDGFPVWIIEDLHAADLGTLDLLTFLAHPLRSMRVLVVATARDKDPRLTERMSQRLTRMSREGLDVRLPSLGQRDVAAVIETTIGRPVPSDLVRRIIDLTSGNPLFVVECARVFKTAGGVEGTLGSLPPSVRQVVRDRVAPLPIGTREALACGAVLGREFSAATIAHMQGSLPARVIDTLLAALRAGIVVELRPGLFAFSHAIVRDAVEDAISPDDLAGLHGRADAALSALVETPDVLGERARHALAALRGEQPAAAPSDSPAQSALALTARAVEILEREQAFDRLFELLQRVDEARSAGLLPPPSADEHLSFARVAREAGRSDVMRRICQAVVTKARAARDGDTFARAALLHASEVRPGVVDRSERGLLEEALRLVESGALACRVLARLATAIQPTHDQAVPIAMIRDAIENARALGDDAALLDVLENAPWGLYCAPLDERIACARELIDRAARAQDVARMLLGHWSLAFCYLEASDFGTFDHHVATMLAIADHPRHRWRPLLLASMRALMIGNFVEADRHFTEVVELAALVDDRSFAVSVALHDLMRKRLQRRDDEVRAALPVAERLMSDFIEAPVQAAAVRASCAAFAGDIAATRAALAVIGGQTAMITSDPTTLALLAHAYAVAGCDDDRRSVRTALSKAESIEVAADVVAFVYEGTVPRLLGLLDSALGDVASGEERMRKAHALATSRGHAPWVAQTAFELATILDRLGQRDDARVFAAQAGSIARDLGMPGLEADASRLAGAPPVPRRDEPAPLQMMKQGATWRLDWGDRRATVKDSRGMQLLARLVAQPNDEIHVLSLANDTEERLTESNAGELVDERALSAYRERLAELDDELAIAERHADRGSMTRLQNERESLVAELTRALGLGGRARIAASVTERARVNVQRRLKDAIARVAEQDEPLAKHLGRSVRTGTFCCFRP
jgi:hypothetical protein